MADPEAKTAVQPTPADVAAAKPGAFTPPRQIGPFELLKLLGRGGMAAVFEARHVKTQQKCALKVMDPNLKSDRTFVERFQLEVKACAKMEHPHVVRVLEHGEAQGWYYLATELIDGGTVADLVTQMGQVPSALALELGAQLLDGLAYAHQQGIVHRDLKPENLLLTKDGVLKVADFGIARTADHTKLTKTGMLVGTAGYMSPEQAKGSSIDGRSDLFTVGIIFYEMLTGSNPFESDNPAASITRIIEVDVPPLFELRPTVPYELEAVVDRLLASNPEERFADAAEAARALAPALTSQRARYPTLVAEAIADPKAQKNRLEREQAAALLAEVTAAPPTNALESSRAALKLHLSTLLDPFNAEAKQQLEDVSAKVKVRFTPSDSPKVRELESTLTFSPKNPMLLAQLGNLYRLEGNLVRSASYLKRYLRLKPNDVYLSGQLTQLTGEKRAPEREKTQEAFAPVMREPTAAQKGAAQLTPGGGVIASPLPQVPGATQSASEAGIFIQRVEVESPTVRAIKRLGPWLVVLLLAVAGWRWASKQFDQAARDSQQQADLVRKRLAQQLVDAQGAGHDFAAEANHAYDLALRLEHGGNYAQALDAYLQVSNQYPNRVEAERAAFRRAKVLQTMKKPADARAAFDQFLSLHPASPDAAEALMRRGECALALADAASAEKDFTDFLERHPSSALVCENWVLRGELRASQHDKLGAKADFRQVLDRLEPQSPLYKRAAAGMELLK
jgi:serine/threonine protein kinase/TolA-binding protein